MKVILLTGLSGAAGAFSRGDEFECSANEAKRLIEAGYANPTREQPVERAVKPTANVEKAAR